MKRHPITITALSSVFLLAAGVAVAEDQERARDRDRDMNQEQTQEREQDIYGSQMMTKEEREQYRAKMRAAKNAEERERIRKEHHEQMKERAKAHGMTLPDEPPEHGMGHRMGDEMTPHERGGMGDGKGGRGR